MKPASLFLALVAGLSLQHTTHAMNTVQRVFLSNDPDLHYETWSFPDQGWKARWVSHGERSEPEETAVYLFRAKFRAERPETIRIHVTADPRYDLYLDGERIGWGSERGMRNTWYYESYELSVDPGEHALVARVAWRGTGALEHYGHVVVRPGFLLHAEGKWAGRLDTLPGNWESVRIPEYSFEPTRLLGVYQVVGGRTVLDAARQDPSRTAGGGDGWRPVHEDEVPLFRSSGRDSVYLRMLTPATLPPMLEKIHMPGRVRFAAYLATADDTEVEDTPVLEKESDAALAGAWASFLAGDGALEVPANVAYRVLVDLGNYYCAFPRLRVSGGAGAKVSVSWAESLFHEKRAGLVKNDRNQIDGKYFRGIYDTLLCCGREHQFFEPFWWSSGRYLQILVSTGDQPLVFESFALRETRFPLEFAFEFASDGADWSATLPILQRTLQMCMHESYMDCPYYEQLMYSGDTRVEVLETYALTRDDRLPKKAQLIFDRSRSESGLALSRAPCRTNQQIPSYSLNWVQMILDYAMWRDDPEFVRNRLDGVRSVILAYRRHILGDGLMHAPKGWNFIDGADRGKATAWRAGIPPSGQVGEANGTHNLLFLCALRDAATLEDLYGEPLFALWARETAADLQEAVVRTFWDEGRGLFAEDPEHTAFSEHAQCLAILGGSVPEGKLEALGEHLVNDPDLARASLYFSFYLFEAAARIGRLADVYPRFRSWFDMPRQGLFTATEYPDSPEAPARSDCHAWSAHPAFHAVASVAGIRPDAPGFKAVRIAPQPGPLHRIEAAAPHPAGGVVRIDLREENGGWRGTAETPDGLPSTFELGGTSLSWNGGKIDIATGE